MVPLAEKPGCQWFPSGLSVVPFVENLGLSVVPFAENPGMPVVPFAMNPRL